MKEEKIYFENEGQKIEGILHLPDHPTQSLIILVHGFTGSRNGPDGIYIKLAEELARRGFAALRFNFRFTTDDFQEFHKMTVTGEVSDLKLIIGEMSKKYDKIGVVGESMGGMISVLGYGEKIKCLVLWYTSTSTTETALTKKISTKEATDELERTGFLTLGFGFAGQKTRIGRDFAEERKSLDLAPIAKKIRCPTLLIHGDADTLVPFNHSEKLLKILKEPKKLERIYGADHAWHSNQTGYDKNAQKQAVESTVKWFEKWLK